MVIASLTVCLLFLGQLSIPGGTAKLEVDVGGTQLEVFTYKPPTYKNGPLLMVFHGVLRNADENNPGPVVPTFNGNRSVSI